MKLVFHSRAYVDVDQILLYYEEVGGQNVAEGFYQEFLEVVKRAAAHPER